MPSNEPTLLVATFGHRWRGDDALGGLVADALRARQDPALTLVDLTEGGPAGLLDALPGRWGLIVVDAVLVEGADSGDLIDLDWRDTSGHSIAHESTCSTHGLSVARQIALAEGLGILPACVRLIGASLQSARLGTGASTVIQAAVPRVVERVIWWMERWR